MNSARTAGEVDAFKLCCDVRCRRLGAHPAHPVEAICTDDRCAQLGIHAAHDIYDTQARARERKKRLGWEFDPLAPMDDRDYRNRYEPCSVLDDAVVEVISYHVPKATSMIQTDLTFTYGEVDQRRLYRSLTRLKNRQRIVHVDLSHYRNGGHLGAYLRPGSKMIKEPLLILEQLDDVLSVRPEKYYESMA